MYERIKRLKDKRRVSETLVFVLIASGFVAAPWAMAVQTEQTRHELPVPDHMQVAAVASSPSSR
jgi:hypothetical protein